MNRRKETAATCRVIRSNASQNRRSISIELCPAAVAAVDGIGQGVVLFVRLKVMPPVETAHLPGSARSKGRRHRLARGGLAHGQRQIRQIAAVPRRQPAEMEAQRVQLRIALHAQS